MLKHFDFHMCDQVPFIVLQLEDLLHKPYFFFFTNYGICRLISIRKRNDKNHKHTT